MRHTLLIVSALLAAPALSAATPQQLLQEYTRQARAEVKEYTAPSVATGRQLFTARPRDWSCSTCHSADPAARGRHVVTGKAIAPLAPAANDARFRDVSRADKWFRRNCNDTLGRPCTAAEKADLLAYLLATGKNGD
jgi:cytochrome c peroxidase